MQDDREMRHFEPRISVQARSNEPVSATQVHMPPVRGASQDALYGRECRRFESRYAKEALRQDRLVAAQRVLATDTGRPTIDDLYCTDLLFQRSGRGTLCVATEERTRDAVPLPRALW
jgi:hypothetical protein